MDNKSAPIFEQLEFFETVSIFVHKCLITDFRFFEKNPVLIGVGLLGCDLAEIKQHCNSFFEQDDIIKLFDVICTIAGL